MVDREGVEEKKTQAEDKRDTAQSSHSGSVNMEITDYVASLDTAKRNAIHDFIEATKESVSVAIEALQQYQWDLLEAVGQFGDDDPKEDKDEIDASVPIVEPLRTRSSPEAVQSKPHQRKSSRSTYTIDTESLRHAVLFKVTRQNGKEHPRSPRSVIFDPIAALERTPPPANAPTPRMFTSSYQEKMWYTGFMRP